MTRKSQAQPELLLGLAALGAAVITIVLVVWINMGLVERAVARDQEAHEILAQADAVMAAMVNQETGLRGYVISANAEFLEPYHAGRRDLEGALARLATLSADDVEQGRHVAEISRLSHAWTQAFASREIAYVEAGEVAKAQAIVKARTGKRLMDAVRAALNDLRRAEGAVIAERREGLQRALATARRMLVLGSLGGLALALMIAGRVIWILLQARRRAEAASAYLNTIVEAMPTMLVVKGADDGRFKLINRACEELLGRGREELIGRTDHELFPAEQADAFVAADREALATPGGLTIVEEPITTSAGVRYLTTRKIKVRLPDGGEHLVCICTDVSHLRAAASALAEALDQAQSADRAKTQFLANISHELRTPLNGVSGSAAVLARTELDDRQLALVGAIRDSASVVDALVGDLLALSRTEGRMAVEVVTFHLADTVRACAAEHRAKADAKGVVLETRIDPTTEIRVRGDAARLQQVLASFLANAVKFTDTGSITVSATAVAAERFRIEVSDTGVGFDLSRKQELFREFAQSDGSATRRYGGAGLGLAIARQAALALGAQLDCLSSPGGGSCFWFEVKLPPEAGEAPLAATRSPGAPARGADAALRVLVVDDHPINRQVLELLLAQLGAECASAEDGQQAVERVATEVFDVVLMDIQMPVMDGITATREIRRLERAAGRPPVPVIIVSANCQPEHVQAGQDAGAQRHLPKPVNAQKLIEALAEVLADQPLDGRSS
jgi:PAS domain S-box-containing protein